MPDAPTPELETLAEEFTDELMYLETEADPYPGTAPTVKKFLQAAYALGEARTRERISAILPLAIPYWKCRACGCGWRDNLDGTVSLWSAASRSCSKCEQSTPEACDIHWLRLEDLMAAAPNPTERAADTEERKCD